MSWKNDFDDKFSSKENSLWKFNIDLNSYTSCAEDIKQFISDLRKKDEEILNKWQEDSLLDVQDAIKKARKKDEEELIKMLPDHSSDGDTDWGNGYDKYRDECLKLIKNYYNN